MANCRSALLSIPLLVFTGWPAQAAVDVPTTLPADETWTAAAGPYRIEADVTVEEGATLTIAPGTRIELAAGRSLFVRGGLAAAEDREAPAYRQAFPDGRTGVLPARREVRLKRVKVAADALERIPGMEPNAQALADALKAVLAALDDWNVAKGRASQAVQAREDARDALVQDYRVVRGTILGRLRVTAEVNALFPDLAPGAGGGKADDAGDEEAPPVPLKAPNPVAA